MNLIFNADDFGITSGVNYGIIDAHKKGVVNSTTALVNGYAIEEAVELSKQNPKLKIGIHFALTFSKACVGGSTLTDQDCNFFKYVELEAKKNEISYEEVLVEFNAQLSKFVALFGFYPDHIDSHHHVHMFPVVNKAVLQIAETLNIPVRGVSCPVILDYFTPTLSLEDLIVMIESLPKSESCAEIMVHPGYVDKTLTDCSSYTLPRTQEVDVLTSSKLQRYLSENGMYSTDFSVCNQEVS